MDSGRLIRYVIGDATNPIGDGHKIIAHVCNDVGAWGAGFVLALSRSWPEAEEAYRAWFDTTAEILAEFPGQSISTFMLGRIELVPVAPAITVCNMVAQHGVGRRGGVPPIRYEALEACLTLVSMHARETGASIHMPRIGCGLAGGTWDKVEPLIERCMQGLDVTVYDLPSRV